MPTPYSFEEQEIGWLTPQKVLVAYMPREDFIELVDEAIQHVSDRIPVYTNRLHELVDPVAKSMERFAVSAWFSPTRGCGCLVGEALIAGMKVEFLDQEEFDPSLSARQKMSERWGDSAPHSWKPVNRILREEYNEGDAELLFDLGNDIDERVKKHLSQHNSDISVDGSTYDPDGEVGDDIGSVVFI